jgi:hypothetical protein
METRMKPYGVVVAMIGMSGLLAISGPAAGEDQYSEYGEVPLLTGVWVRTATPVTPPVAATEAALPEAAAATPERGVATEADSTPPPEIAQSVTKPE